MYPVCIEAEFAINADTEDYISGAETPEKEERNSSWELRVPRIKNENRDSDRFSQRILGITSALLWCMDSHSLEDTFYMTPP